jgi:hypothetical protein
VCVPAGDYAFSAVTDDTLSDFRADLLKGKPTRPPHDGREALEFHKLLTSAIHRAAGLNKRCSERDGESWTRYFCEHFPAGRNYHDDANALWTDWRTRLLKTGSPGPRIGATHGQAAAHWYREPDGRLSINLEDMWVDFEASVDHFMAELGESPSRREVVLSRWRGEQHRVAFLIGADGEPTNMTASVARAIGVRPPG